MRTTIIILLITLTVSSCAEKPAAFTAFETLCLSELKRANLGDRKITDFLNRKDLRLELTQEMANVYSADLTAAEERARVSFLVGPNKQTCRPFESPIFSR
jgi:hypothetical protein